MSRPEDETDPLRYRVVGIDCADDAAEIVEALEALGISSPRVSLASHTLTIPHQLQEDGQARVRDAVEALGYQLHPERDGTAAPDDLAPSYKRALWAVVLLNVGFGVVEMTGGMLAGSQALKADALDFLGDGLISFLGLVAIGWRPIWRARSALVQGLFLGALGLAVIGTTFYRAISQEAPEPEVMGVLGFAALATNVAAALLLIPHRSGDASARAVWLFSRNDAIGNAAVIVAAGFVLWTGSAWPDLLVALLIASLFMSASWSIVRDALSELRV